MRGVCRAGLILAAILGMTDSVRAGLYNPNEVNHFYPIKSSTDRFQDDLSDLRGLAGDLSKVTENQWIKDYLKRFNDLREAEKTGKLPVADRIELGACYLRFPSTEGATKAIKPADAIRVLEPALAENPRNFMVLANLAIAYQLDGNFERAVNYEGLALEAWPDAYPGFTADQLHWYRRVEKFHYLLMMLRHRENEHRVRPEDKTIDALFAPANLMGREESYEAGKIAPRQWAELPGDAVPIVEQLIFWLPFDNRLYWLLGELLNAKGDAASAFQILNDLVDMEKRKEQSRVLRQHWRVLADANKTLKKTQEGTTETTDSTRTTIAEKPSSAWLPDLRAVGVGFAGGVMATLLAALQFREIRRRREMRSGHPSSGVG